MKKFTKLAILPLFALLSMGAQAELISTDWKAGGDSLATLDTQSGLEWLDLSQTENMSIAAVEGMIDTGNQFEGWRLPTASEVVTMMRNQFTDVNIHDSLGYSYSSQQNTAQYIDFQEKFGYSYSGSSTTLGFHYNSTENGVIINGVHSGQIRSNHIASSSTSYANMYYGVYLVSDGGTTLSSIANPHLNAANPDAPVNNGGASVPLSGSLAFLGLGLAGLSFRRKQ